MRSIRIIVSVSLTLVLCIAALATHAAQTEVVFDQKVDNPEFKPGDKIEEAAKVFYQPALTRADRQALLQKNPEMDRFEFGFDTNTLFREVMRSSIEKPGYNEQFFIDLVYDRNSANGFERNQLAHGVSGDLLFQRSTNEDTNGELWGWYAVGAVSAFLVTGALIYLLSGDSGSPSIPEPPGRP